MNPPVFNKNRAMCLIAANAIGTGIFTTSGYAIRDLQSPWLVLSIWILGGIYSLLGVFSYSTLHEKFPGSGGEYHFLSKGLHPKLGAIAGFATILMGFTAPVAASCMAFSVYFLKSIPMNINSSLLAILVLTFVFILHYTSLHKGMKWHDSFIYLKLFLFVILILVMVFSADWYLPSFDFEFNIYTYARSFFWIAYAYSGWNAVYYVASELTSNNSEVNKASYLGSSTVILLYVALNIPLLFGLSVEQLSGIPEVVAVFFEVNTGYSSERVISMVIALGLLSTISSFMIIVPRIYSRMAEDKVIPKFFYFKPGTHPHHVFLFQYLLTISFLLVFDFEFILNSAGFVLTVCSLLSVISLYVQRTSKLSVKQIIGTSGYIGLTSLLVYFGGPWFHS